MAIQRRKLDEELVAHIVRRVHFGISLRTIAREIGYSENAIRKWLKLGREQEGTLYAQLAEAVDRAREDAEDLGGPMDEEELFLVASRVARSGDVSAIKVVDSILERRKRTAADRGRRDEEPRVLSKMDELAAKRAAARGS